MKNENKNKKRRSYRKPFLLIALMMLLYFLASGIAMPFPGWLNIAWEKPEPCILADQIIAANTDLQIGSCPAGSGHDVISLFEDVTLSMPLPPIRSTITIEGNGHRIDGDGRFRIFEVLQYGDLRINELTLQNGRAFYGGAIKVGKSGKVTLRRSTITDSSAVSGGAIASDPGAIALVGSRLIANDASSLGGAIYTRDSIVTIQSSSLSGNQTAKRGGAIYASLSNIQIQASAINANRAYASGGGASFIGSSAEISRSTFSGNAARENGGGIESGGSTMTISDSVFASNSAKLRGGGIYQRRSNVTMTHVTVFGNSSSNGVGGVYKDYGTLNLRNSIISNDGHIDCFALLTLEQNINNFIQDGSCDPMLSGDPKFGLEAGEATRISLRSNSPAIDAAHPDYCSEVDIRGVVRPKGAACDIGAFEFADDS